MVNIRMNSQVWLLVGRIALKKTMSPPVPVTSDVDET